MMRRPRCAFAGALLCVIVTSACAEDRVEPATQIIVAVYNQIEPQALLSRLEVLLEPEDGQPTNEPASFKLVDSDPKEGQLVLPALITMVPAPQRPASPFRLSIVGYHREDGAGEVPWVRQTALLSFKTGKTLKTTFVLASECAMRECPGETCYVRPSPDGPHGECGRIVLADLREIPPPASDDATTRDAVLAAPPPPLPPEPPSTEPPESEGVPKAGSCDASPCEHGKCVQKPPGYVCSCVGTGFGGELCEKDIDECASDNGGCAPAAQCMNESGSRRCKCPDTHRGDGLGAQGCETRVTQLAARGSHTCALLATGDVKCWGKNWLGQLGDGTFSDRPDPVLVQGLRDVIEIATGDEHSCAITSDRALHCWGANMVGQLGDGSTNTRLTPVPVGGGLFAEDITAGANHNCVRQGTAVWCWGWNSHGQLGDDTGQNYTAPVSVAYASDGTSRNAELLSAGERFSCVAHDAGVDCWGEFKSSASGTRASRRFVDGEVKSLASGRDQACAVTKDGRVLCWGNLGSPSDSGSDGEDMAWLDLGGSQVVGLAIGWVHACAALGDGTVKCWGLYASGGFEPRTVPRLKDVQQVVVGFIDGCALLKDGSVQCWELTDDPAALPEAQPSPLHGL